MSSNEKVDLLQLPLPQLQNLRSQMEEELSHLTGSFGSLKAAQQKFLASVECLESLEAGGEGKPALIPLTGSLYVPGEMGNPDEVIVDVGTGYFVTKTNKDAREFFKRKSDFLSTNLEKVAATINERQGMLRAIMEATQMKMAMVAREGQSKS